jgi:hypothetical protein
MSSNKNLSILLLVGFVPISKKSAFSLAVIEQFIFAPHHCSSLRYFASRPSREAKVFIYRAGWAEQSRE